MRSLLVELRSTSRQKKCTPSCRTSAGMAGALSGTAGALSGTTGALSGTAGELTASALGMLVLARIICRMCTDLF